MFCLVSMKKLILLIFLLPLYCLAQQSSAYYRKDDRVFVHAPNGLNMRQEAKASSAKVIKIPYGNYVRVVSQSNEYITINDFGGYPIRDIWYEVTYQGQQGFVFGGYLARFRPVPQKLETPTIDGYIKEMLNEKQKLVLEKYSVSSGQASPCHTLTLYEEGVIVTEDFCAEKCNAVRYLFEDTQVSEVASLMQAIYAQGIQTFKFEYNEERDEIYITLEACEITIREISTGGVILEVFCCC